MNDRPDVSTNQISISDGVIDDLRRRLRASHMADMWPYQEWEQGTPSSYLRDLAREWSEHDWSASQVQLNRLPHFTATVDAVLIHFLVSVTTCAPGSARHGSRLAELGP